MSRLNGYDSADNSPMENYQNLDIPLNDSEDDHISQDSPSKIQTYITPVTTIFSPDTPVPVIQNVVATVSLGIPLDLKKIALLAKNTQYNPTRFIPVIMRILQPRTTALIFPNGKIVCTGAKSEELCEQASRKYAKIVQKLGFQTKLINFKIENVVASCDVRFQIQLEGLNIVHTRFSSYEPELFPGLHYRMVKPKVTVAVFKSGKVNFTGAKNKKDIDDAFEQIYPILKSFKK